MLVSIMSGIDIALVVLIISGLFYCFLLWAEVIKLKGKRVNKDELY